MTGLELVAALLAGSGLAVLVAPRPRPVLTAARRAAGVGVRTAAGQPGPGGLGDARGMRLACALAGAAVALLWSGPGGLVAGAGLGLVVLAAGPRLLARLEPGAVRDTRRRLVADLPLALDLLAACLAGGATLPGAAAAVSAAVDGPVGDRLGRVAAALAVGSPPEEAWSALSGGPGADPGDPLAPAARTLARAAKGGAPVVGAVGRLAAEARAADRARGKQAARRAGVLAVAPLGLCFLPAFVLLGVVPVVAGLVAPLLASY